MKVREDQLERFKKQAAEVIRLTPREGHANAALRLVLSDDETECEIREAYVGADAFLESSQRR
jgi:hypothetical protein